MSSGQIFRGLTVVFSLACLGVSFAGQAPGAGYDEKKVADFYRGKTVRIIVGFSAGGGYDQYSRLIGRHLSKYIPGNPAIVVDNMAGAGSIIAANHVYNAAAKDGTVIGNISGPIILEQLVRQSGDSVRYGEVSLSRRAGERDLYFYRHEKTRRDQVRGVARSQRQNRLSFGGIPGSTVEHAPILVRDILGANVKMVLGYKGTADVRMAIDSGEVDGLFNSYTSLKITSFDKMRSGEWVLLAQLGEKPIKDLIVPNVPTIPTTHQKQRAPSAVEIRHEHTQRFRQGLRRSPRHPGGSGGRVGKGL